MRGSTQVSAVLDLEHASNVGEGRESTLEYAVEDSGLSRQVRTGEGHQYQLLGFDGTEQKYCSSSRMDVWAASSIPSHGRTTTGRCLIPTRSRMLPVPSLTGYHGPLLHPMEDDEAYSYPCAC